MPAGRRVHPPGITGKECTMRFYNTPHKHYCGVDLHARTLYLCIIDRDGVVLVHRSLPCDPQRFLLAIAPFREDLVVAVECVYSWYWLADSDLAARESWGRWDVGAGRPVDGMGFWGFPEMVRENIPHTSAG
jgi:hypothetical protein